jgi:chromatin assembly factor 1 subunit A
VTALVVDTTPTTTEPAADDDAHSISKRQMEITIMAMATREKRSHHKRVCWYVNDSVLEQYAMTDIALPNAWDYVSMVVAKDNSNQEKAVTGTKSEDGGAVTPGRRTPVNVSSITQFTQALSPAQFAAAAAVTAHK